MTTATYDPSKPFDLVKGSRVRVRRFVTELVSLAGVTPKLGAREDEFTGTVRGIYGNHPTAPTLIEVRVERDDTGEEIYCNVQTVVEILPGPADPVEIPELSSTGSWFRRKLKEGVDAALGEVDIVADESVTNLTCAADSMELEIELEL